MDAPGMIASVLLCQNCGYSGGVREHLIGFHRVTLVAESQDSVTRITAMIANAYGTT